MTIFNIPLTASDIIDLLGIAASLTVSVVAIIISILALRQNSKMIEDSTRPNIQIYPVYLDHIFYIVIRNFGNSEAIIDELKCYHKFNEAEYFRKYESYHYLHPSVITGYLSSGRGKSSFDVDLLRHVRFRCA